MTITLVLGRAMPEPLGGDGVRARSFNRLKPGYRMRSFVQLFHEDLTPSGRKATKGLARIGGMKVHNFGESKLVCFKPTLFLREPWCLLWSLDLSPEGRLANRCR